MSNLKLYIAVREEVDSFMVPTLVAHTILGAHLRFEKDVLYSRWLEESFKKVVLKVNKKEWGKIISIPDVYLGYEHTQLFSEDSCAIIPVMLEYPNVIKFSKTWRP